MEALIYLDYLPSALPYHLLSKPDVLILGAGGGMDILQALYHRSRKIDAVELNPQVIELVQSDFKELTGGLFSRPNVQYHLAEARSFIAGSADRYDLIQVALLDAFSTAAAGLYALSESYLYTVEAFSDYIKHLQPNGLLTVTRWVHLPPRDSLKLFATAVKALEALDVPEPGSRLLLIRGWKTSTLVVKNGVINKNEIVALKAFCRKRSFDIVWYPGVSNEEVNRYNVQNRPYMHEGTVALLGPQRDDFMRRYKFDIAPATDDRPYFYKFFKWQTLLELIALQARGGLGQVEWGYLIPVVTLIQALLTGTILIILPLLFQRSHQSGQKKNAKLRIFSFFSAIGLAFLFLEIAFIQKFILYLGNPLYAISVVLCAFLVWAGLGSRWSQSIIHKQAAIIVVVIGITFTVIIYLWALPVIFEWGLTWPDPVKIATTVLLIAPLAFCMGIPFPLGLSRVANTMPILIPWAWAINGCASVVSAVLATLLAVQVGFTGVVIFAVGLYGLATLVAPEK